MTEPRPEDVASALQHGVAPSTLLGQEAPQDGAEAPRHNTPDTADTADTADTDGAGALGEEPA